LFSTGVLCRLGFSHSWAFATGTRAALRSGASEDARMPRTARSVTAGVCYHVINRGNNCAQVFGCVADYRAFLELIAAAQGQAPVELLAACLMPNHFHFVVIPGEPDALARWMHWLLTTHVRRLHQRDGTSGRVWQGRFKAFPIQHDEHLLTVMRYVERNPLRAGLVNDAAAWPWGSLAWRAGSERKTLLADCPVKLPTTGAGGSMPRRLRLSSRSCAPA
jgi:REP element-mobilizing transposase RayT